MTGDVQLARRVRVATWAAAERATPGPNRDQTVLAAINASHPRAVATFGRASLLALTRDLGPGVCSWCAATVLAAGGQEPAPSLSSESHQALLGRPCQPCQRRHARAQARAREARHVEEVTAAGLSVAAAGRIRDAGFARQLGAEIERLRAAEPRRSAAPLTVRDSINLARARQRAREATYARRG